MAAIHACSLPLQALLARYANTGAYADCYVAEVGRAVSQAEFVEAFYTGAVFKIERWLLRLFLSKPCNDAQVRQLAAGQLDTFSAWRVEGRAADQLLLCDINGRTRSWLMVVPLAGETGAGTRLYFGSAVVPVMDRSTGQARMGWAFKALLGFHRLYSRVLLGSACARLVRRRR
ncbi:MAG: hypothetical protein ABI574_08500 [Burkholderiales bacterium]